MARAKQKLIATGELARATGLSIIHLRKLADEVAIPTQLTPVGQRRFHLVLVNESLQKREAKKKKNSQKRNEFHANYELENLKEDQVWAEVAKKLGLSRASPAWDVAPPAFTEMLNIAIDH